MPFQKGQSGNPGGRVKDKPFDKQLRVVLTDTEDQVGKDAKKKTALRVIVEQLVAQAMEGEGWAIKEIADRVDGKAPQSIQHSDPDGGPVQVTWFSDKNA